MRVTHAGVKFRYGNKVVPITANNGLFGTGIHFYWPLLTEVDIVPIERRTTNLNAQYLTTSDKRSVGVSGICVFKVRDVSKLLTRTWDYQDTITDYGLAAVRNVVATNKFDDLLDPTIDVQLTKQLRKELNYYGIEVIKVSLNDYAEAFILGHIGVGFLQSD